MWRDLVPRRRHAPRGRLVGGPWAVWWAVPGRCALHRDGMNNTVVHTQRTSTTPTTHLARRHERRTRQEELFHETLELRKRAVYRKARSVPDAQAEVDVSVWEAIHRGVTDHDDLWDVARAAAVRQRRWATRQQRNDSLPIVLGPEPVDPFAIVDMRVDASRAIRRTRDSGRAPTPQVVQWATHTAGLSAGPRLPGSVRMAGSRWIEKVREQLELCDDVA